MASDTRFRDLLIADLAVELGIASARDVALAIRSGWEGGAGLLEELKRQAGIPDADFARLEAAADALIRDAGGAPRFAIGARAGIDRSIHEKLSAFEPTLARTLSEAGAFARVPLHTVPEERYLGFEPVGEGGMGIVYLALDTEMNRNVAIKVVRPDRADTEVGPSPLSLAPPGRDTPASAAFQALSARLLQEAWVTGGLEHPGIVPVYELGQTPAGIPYYTMRFVRGERTLESAIGAVETLESRLALLEPFLRICDTLAYAHANGVIHRDLKPANIALGEFGEVVVLDWGLAKLRDRPDLSEEQWRRRIADLREVEDLNTRAGPMGTPGYMAPEAVLGAPGGIDERADVYGLGAILYQILTGRLPHEFGSFPEWIVRIREEDPRPPRDIDSGLPPALSRICLEALARDPDARTASALELADALRAWQQETAVDQEVERILGEAESARTAAAALTGAALLAQADLMAAAARRVEQLRPGHARASELRAESGTLRVRALEQSARTARRSLLRRVAVVSLVVALFAAAGVAWLLEGRRRAEEEQRLRAVEAEKRTRVALEEARVQGLAIASERVQEQEPMLALHLARAAVRLRRTPLTTKRLRDALLGSRERREFLVPGVVSAAYSPAGDRILTAANDGTARIHDLEGKELVLLRGPEGWITHAGFLPDGEVVFTAHRDHTVHLFSTEGSRLGICRGHEGRITAVAVSPLGDRIATASSDGTARLFDLEGREIAVLRGHGDVEPPKRSRVRRDPGFHTPVTAVEFSPDGTRILTAGMDGTARLWDLEGRQLGELSGNRADSLYWASFSRDGHRVIAASLDTVGYVWNLEGDELARLETSPGRVNLYFACFSPSGLYCLTANSVGTVRIWDPRYRETAVLQGHTQIVDCATFSPAEDRVLTDSNDGTARLWNMIGNCLAVIRGGTTSAVFSPAGDRILSAGWGDRVRVWDVESFEVARIRERGQTPKSVIFLPSGDRFLAVQETPKIYDLEGREKAALRSPHAVKLAAVSPRGDRIVTACAGSANAGCFSPRIWDPTGLEVGRLEGHTKALKEVAFTPSGDRIITSSSDGTVRVWDMNGRPLCVMKVVSKGSGLHGFSVSNEHVLTNGMGWIRLWDSAGRELWSREAYSMAPVLSPTGKSYLVRDTFKVRRATGRARIRLQDLDGTDRAGFTGSDPVFSPAGDRVLTSFNTGRELGTLRLWDVEGRETAILRGHTQRIESASFSPTGDRIITASRDGTARIWNLDGGELAVLRGHELAVDDAALSPDGTRAVTVAWPGEIRIWYTRPEDLLELADRRVTRQLTEEERARFGPLLSEE